MDSHVKHLFKNKLKSEASSSSSFKKGDRVKVRNAKSYDSAVKPEVNGTVEYVNKDGTVNVKVGTGGMTVYPDDLEKISESVNSSSIESSMRQVKMAINKASSDFMDIVSSLRDDKALPAGFQSSGLDAFNEIGRAIDASFKKIQKLLDSVK